MRLRKPCEHDQYAEHAFYQENGNRYAICPGGEFLPEDALVLVYADVDKETAMDLFLDFFDREEEAS